MISKKANDYIDKLTDFSSKTYSYIVARNSVEIALEDVKLRIESVIDSYENNEDVINRIKEILNE